ncbi:MAG: transposase [Ferruginibacter sp.]
MADTTKRKRYSKAEILEKLRLQETSNSTVTEFCKAHHIHKATFYNWRNRFSIEAEEQPKFVPLHFAEQTLSEKLFAEIQFSSTVRVKLFQEVEASYFKALIQ